MKNILILGAGRSSLFLIEYLLQNAKTGGWQLKVGDMDMQLAIEKIGGHPAGKAFRFEASNDEHRSEEIKQADLVISMLPPSLHILVAKDCLHHRKHLLTASYLSPELRLMDAEAKRANVIFLNEIGLDPGIDHLSAMKVINEVKAKGGKMISFKSYTGGLMDDDEKSDNPWRYKFTWNPRNVVLAGQSTARYLENKRMKFVPYHRLFAEAKEVDVVGEGTLDAYPNRDSLNYMELYGLQDIETMIRGTLRRKGYCKAWSILVGLGLTDDTYEVEGMKGVVWSEFIQSFVSGNKDDIIENIMDKFQLHSSPNVIEKLKWLGLFSSEKIRLNKGSPAAILLELLERKWKLLENEKDIVLMQHEFVYSLKNEKFKHISTLVERGTDSSRTAMAKTVGLPIAIAAKMILENKINLRGVMIPIYKEIYEPVLEELEKAGIKLKETVNTLS